MKSASFSAITRLPAFTYKAELAAQAAEAAGEQGKFWEMHDILFTKQSEWNSLSSADFTTWVTEQAKGLGLDTANFTATMTAEATAKRVKASEEHAQTSGINSTPFLFVNNLPYGGRRDVESLTSLLEFFKLEDRAYDTCPEMTIDPNKKYTATIKTERGDVVIELFADKAPWAVNSFVFLAREGWYDNTPFHRVIANFVAQGGDPSGSGFGSPTCIPTKSIPRCALIKPAWWRLPIQAPTPMGRSSSSPMDRSQTWMAISPFLVM